VRRLIVVGLIALILAGCGSLPQYRWAKSGASESEAMQAQAQCEYESEAHARSRTLGLQTGIGVEYDRLQHKKELMQLCMRAKGYYQEQVSMRSQS
jgi:hypothetical protein